VSVKEALWMLETVPAYKTGNTIRWENTVVREPLPPFPWIGVAVATHTGEVTSMLAQLERDTPDRLRVRKSPILLSFI
jgi:hypothetical protein